MSNYPDNETEKKQANPGEPESPAAPGDDDEQSTPTETDSGTGTEG